MTKKKTKKKKEKIGKEALNIKQRKFCELYATDREFFGNGVESYSEAYDIDLSKRGAYKACAVSASRLLIKANILLYINKLLELKGLNNTYVDKQLELLITQNADFKTKLGAIKEYNQLMQRIIKKLDLTSAGKPIPILSGNVYSNNSDKKNKETDKKD